MADLVLTNANLVLADEVVHGTLLIRDGQIEDIANKTAQKGEDMGGDYILPGLIELHTDHLENHYRPRPGVQWPAVSAVMAHDAQIAAAGITTVFDALRAGSFDPGDYLARDGEILMGAIRTAQEQNLLRAEHFIHLRCELPCPDTLEAAQLTAQTGRIHLISLMDHTPGARQFTSLDKFKQYYLGRKLIVPEKIDAYIEERRAYQIKYAAHNKQGLLDMAKAYQIPMLSHDDATPAHVEEAVADGVMISEFPTTAESAAAAHKHGLKILMGAPNLIRGGSHSGNISTEEVARAGYLDIMSSDYVPASLLMAAFELPKRVETITLPQAIATVSKNSAAIAGLNDRGEIALGKRADLVRVSTAAQVPLVKQLWRQGSRVL